MLAPEIAPEIERGLRLIRLRQRRLGYVLWGFLPFVLVAGFARNFPEGIETPFIVAAVFYGALLLFYSLRLAFTDCPRCERFYHLNWWADPWTKRCLHCGLSLGNRA